MSVGRDLLRRVQNVERVATRYRQGKITSTSPLSVALGGSTTSYTNVRTILGTGLAVGDTVSVLVLGNDLLVLGKIGSSASPVGTDPYMWASSSSGVAVNLSFTLPRRSTCMLTFSGTGYRSAVGVGYLDCYLNGGYVTSILHYFNQTYTHATVPTLSVTYVLDAGTHTMGMGAGGGTIRDASDTFFASVIAMPRFN